MTFPEVWTKTDQVSGLYLKEEARCLYNAVRRVPRGGKVVELGPLFGRSTTVLAEVGKVLKLDITCIDCFAIESTGAREAFERNVLLKYPDVTLLETTTAQAAESWRAPIHFLHIDADHQEDSIQRDCENWIKHVAKGSMVAFHDYTNWMFPSVAKWADYYTGEWEEVCRGGSLLVRQKP